MLILRPYRDRFPHLLQLCLSIVGIFLAGYIAVTCIDYSLEESQYKGTVIFNYDDKKNRR